MREAFLLYDMLVYDLLAVYQILCNVALVKCFYLACLLQPLRQNLVACITVSDVYPYQV